MVLSTYRDWYVQQAWQVWTFIHFLYRSQPETESRWKCCVKFLITASIRTCHPEHLLGDHWDHLNSVWIKNFKRSHLVLICLFFSANALWAETGGGNIDLQVSMLDCMDFSSVNWFLCIESENQLFSILFGCRTEKIWGKEILNSKSTDTWKSKSSEDKWVFMN